MLKLFLFISIFSYFCYMKYIIYFLFFLLFPNSILSQIVIDNNAPYNNANWLVDNILLGGGVVASNHSFQGDPFQIGWFNATNTNLGIDSGIVLSTGDIYSLDPINGSTFPVIVNAVTDPDLLNVANSVPPLINQSFSVNAIYDVAVLEFDFVPTSDSLSFRYVFGSQEYFAYENTQYNDVFGFFLSGPGISGPYSAPAIHPNGAINLAIIPNSNPPLPITISSVNNVTPINQQYFVDNQSGLSVIASADGLTTVLTAKALVQCNETYHIRLAIADGSDNALDSYVWLESGSFESPALNVIDDLGIDSTIMQIPCNSSITLIADGGIGASYQWFDSTANLISTDSFIVAGGGTYWVEATSFGCPVISDTLKIYEDDSPFFELGVDYKIDCNTTTLINPTVSGGQGNYQYLWTDLITSDTLSFDSIIVVSEGFYALEVDDGTGCFHLDSILITEFDPPNTLISGGGSICDNGSTVDIFFNFDGLTPWDLIFSDGSINFSVSDIQSATYTHTTNFPGQYSIQSVDDVNGCISDISNSIIDVIVNPLPVATITPSESIIYIGDAIELYPGEYAFYEWYDINDSLISTEQNLKVTESGSFYVWVQDINGCTDISEIATVNTVPKTELFVPTAFTPNGDEHNELFLIQGLNIVDYNIKIFNRWGEMVFESNSINKSWDGFYNSKKVQQGTYFCYITILGADGNIFEKRSLVQLNY